MPPVTDAERTTLEDDPRSPDALVLRGCQILLAGARSPRAPASARHLGRDDQTVHDAIRAFRAEVVGRLQRMPSRPRSTRPKFAPGAPERLRAPLRRSPRDFGHPTGPWALAAGAAHAQG